MFWSWSRTRGKPQPPRSAARTTVPSFSSTGREGLSLGSFLKVTTILSLRRVRLEIRLVQFVLAGSAFSSWTGPVAILSSTVWYPVCSPGKLQLSKWEKNARETLGVMNQHAILLEAIG